LPSNLSVATGDASGVPVYVPVPGSVPANCTNIQLLKSGVKDGPTRVPEAKAA